MYLIDHIGELRFVNRLIYAMKQTNIHTVKSLGKTVQFSFPSRLFRPTYTQGRITHCAICAMAWGPRRRGPPRNRLRNFYYLQNDIKQLIRKVK